MTAIDERSAMNRPLVVVAVMLSMFMAALEATVVATAMPTVVADLHGIELYGYTSSLYLLASTVATPLAGKLADREGRKFVFGLGSLLFLLGSMASGAAPSMLLLVIARVVQGLGAGALQPVGLVVIADIFTLKERGKFQGLFAAVWGLAGAIGPLVGGLIVQALSWRWVFYINLPAGLLSVALFFSAYQEPSRTKIARLDWLGASLLASSVSLLLLASSDVARPLTLPLTIATLVGFVWSQRRAEDPVLPPSLFSSRVITVASVTNVLLGAMMMSLLTYIPLYVQGVALRTPAEAGGAVAPMLLGWPVAATLSARLIFRTGPRFFLRLGTALTLIAAGIIPFALGSLEGAWLSWLHAAMAVFGLGMGAASLALIYSVQEAAAPEHRGVASATVVFFRLIGGAIAVGVFGAVFVALIGDTLSDETISRILQAHEQTLEPSLTDANARDTLQQALLPLLRLEVGIALVALLTSWLFPLVRWQTQPTDATANADAASSSHL